MNEILEQLEINKTFFYQFVLFGAFFLILSQIYLKPFQRLIEKRNQKLKDDVESSAELLKSIDSRIAEYEKALATTRAQAIQSYEATMAEVRANEQVSLNQLKDELKKDFLEASNEMHEERLKIESELKLQLGPTSDSLAQKILAGN
jgi:F0F1-type ATP synthase membrane subunit b/b'